jgi:hypothetical protein
VDGYGFRWPRLPGENAPRHRRGEVRTATKNQLLTELDRAFPALSLALAAVLGTKTGRLVAARFR